ncbi:MULTISPECIES: hypothetical protein [unclassified Streptomyces]|uniref:hypothetical protein n=1 Tax=unclassified Streptomyces TaxID=2593676 RepID=UPI0037B48CFD
MADPCPLYRQLREEGPVRRTVIAGGLEAWLVTRYKNGLSAKKDGESVTTIAHSPRA